MIKINSAKSAVNLCPLNNRCCYGRTWTLEVQQQQTLHNTEIWVHLKHSFCFTLIWFLIVTSALFWQYMLCNTAPLSYVSRAKPDNMAPVWTIRNLLGKKKRQKKVPAWQACHTAPASYATSVSTGMWKCAIKWSWHSTKQFMKVVCQQHFFVCAQTRSGWWSPTQSFKLSQASLYTFYILNCTDCAPGVLPPQKDTITTLWAKLKQVVV